MGITVVVVVVVVVTVSGLPDMWGTISKKFGSKWQYLVRKFCKYPVTAHVFNQWPNQICSHAAHLHILVSTAQQSKLSFNSQSMQGAILDNCDGIRTC